MAKIATENLFEEIEISNENGMFNEKEMLINENENTDQNNNFQ